MNKNKEQSWQILEGMYFALLMAYLAYWSWWLHTKLETWALLGGVFLAWFFSVIALGTIRMALLAAIESRRVGRTLAGELPKDGEYAAIVGELKTEREAIVSPCLAEPCIAYEYRVTVGVRQHTTGGRKNMYSWTTKTVFGGVGLVPYSIESSGCTYRVIAFPKLSNCSWRRSSQEKDLERARRFLLESAESIEQPDGIRLPEFTEPCLFEKSAALTERRLDSSKKANLNWQCYPHDSLAKLRSDIDEPAGEAWLNAIEFRERAPRESSAWERFLYLRRHRFGRVRYARPYRVELSERVLKPGDIVCVQGVFSATDQSIEPDPGKAWRLVKGDPARLPKSLAYRSAAMAFAGLSGLVVIHLSATLIGDGLFGLVPVLFCIGPIL